VTATCLTFTSYSDGVEPSVTHRGVRVTLGFGRHDIPGGFNIEAVCGEHVEMQQELRFGTQVVDCLACLRLDK
jgi:hypothetical protein